MQRAGASECRNCLPTGHRPLGDRAAEAIADTAHERPDGRTVAAIIAELHQRTRVLVMADRSTLEEGRSAAEAGAFSVVVSTAITHPSTITEWFADAVSSAPHG